MKNLPRYCHKNTTGLLLRGGSGERKSLDFTIQFSTVFCQYGLEKNYGELQIGSHTSIKQ